MVAEVCWRVAPGTPRTDCYTGMQAYTREPTAHLATHERVLSLQTLQLDSLKTEPMFLNGVIDALCSQDMYLEMHGGTRIGELFVLSTARRTGPRPAIVEI